MPVEPQFDPIAHHFADGRQSLEVLVGPAAAGDRLRMEALFGQFARDLGSHVRPASGQPDRHGHPPPIVSAQQIAQRLPQHPAQQVPHGHLHRRPQRRRRERFERVQFLDVVDAPAGQHGQQRLAPRGELAHAPAKPRFAPALQSRGGRDPHQQTNGPARSNRSARRQPDRTPDR